MGRLILFPVELPYQYDQGTVERRFQREYNSTMITEAAKTFLDFLKLAPRYLIALGLMAGLLLFLKQEFLNLIGVAEFANNYRTALGLILVFTGSLFVVSICIDGFSFLKRAWGNWKLNQRMTQRLNCLTEDEKQILRYYYAKQTRANSLRINDGIVQGLVAKGIIYRSSNFFDLVEGCAHNITDAAWDYLHRHSDLLVGTTDIYRTDKQDDDWRL